MAELLRAPWSIQSHGMLNRKFHPPTQLPLQQQHSQRKALEEQQMLARIHLSPTWISYPREGYWLVWDSGIYLWSVLVVLVRVSARGGSSWSVVVTPPVLWESTRDIRTPRNGSHHPSQLQPPEKKSP